MERVEQDIADAKEERFRRYSDFEWCNAALSESHWTIYRDLYLEGEISPESIRDFADQFEQCQDDGWRYEYCESDGPTRMTFSMKIPVTDEEREQARAWLEKYSD